MKWSWLEAVKIQDAGCGTIIGELALGVALLFFRDNDADMDIDIDIRTCSTTHIITSPHMSGARPLSGLKGPPLRS